MAVAEAAGPQPTNNVSLVQSSFSLLLPSLVSFHSPSSLYSMLDRIYTRIFQVSNEYFSKSLLPPLPPWLDVEKVCTKLKENGKLVYDDDDESYSWKDWEIEPKPDENYRLYHSYLKEYKRSLGRIMKSIVRVLDEDTTLKSKRTLDFRLGGWRHKEICEFDPDAVLCSRDPSDSYINKKKKKRVIWSNAAIPISFMSDDEEDLYPIIEPLVRNIYT